MEASNLLKSDSKSAVAYAQSPMISACIPKCIPNCVPSIHQQYIYVFISQRSIMVFVSFLVVQRLYHECDSNEGMYRFNPGFIHAEEGVQCRKTGLLVQ
jgi:hypothetical protein